MGNPMCNPIGNPIGNPMTNPMGNPMSHPMGNPLLELALHQAPESWQALVRHLPTGTEQEERAVRMALYDRLDVNGNGHLSLAEIEKGLLEGHEFLDGHTELLRILKPAIMRAYQAAKGASHVGGVSDAYIERREFRLLLIYLVRYVSLLSLFKLIDKNGDKRIEKKEFIAALPLLSPWGVHVSDPHAEFAQLDENGGGYILFEEFSHWSIVESFKSSNGSLWPQACKY